MERRTVWIGNGRLSQCLQPLFQKAGYVPHAILDSQSPPSAWQTACGSAEVCCLAVPDDQIASCAQQAHQWLPPAAWLWHFAGSVPLSAITLSNRPVGVFYPLQSFSTPLTSLQGTAVFLEVGENGEEMLTALTTLATQLGCHPTLLNSDQRTKLHLAAVMAANFTNHLLHQTQQYMQAQGLRFEVLEALVAHTVRQAFALNPAAAQTGPAARQDEQTLKIHEKLLAEHPTLQTWYKAFSQSIQEHIGNNRR